MGLVSAVSSPSPAGSGEACWPNAFLYILRKKIASGWNNLPNIHFASIFHGQKLPHASGDASLSFSPPLDPSMAKTHRLKWAA